MEAYCAPRTSLQGTRLPSGSTQSPEGMLTRFPDALSGALSNSTGSLHCRISGVTLLRSPGAASLPGQLSPDVSSGDGLARCPPGFVALTLGGAPLGSTPSCAKEADEGVVLLRPVHEEPVNVGKALGTESDAVVPGGVHHGFAVR